MGLQSDGWPMEKKRGKKNECRAQGVQELDEATAIRRHSVAPPQRRPPRLTRLKKRGIPAVGLPRSDFKGT